MEGYAARKVHEERDTSDDGTHIIGFCHVAPSRDGDAERGMTGEITAIYVEPGAWRLGHGGKLCGVAEQELAGRGFSRVTLWVLEKNLAACRFYEQHGFQRDGTSKFHETSGAIEVRYGKGLRQGG
jgi:ribosomal protein S18 acetylase RimI-like enzyme